MILVRVAGGLGRGMIAAGVLILLFVVYQLWGTGVRTARVQNELEDRFERAAADFAESNPELRRSNPRRPQPVPERRERGEWVANIRIPAIGVDWIFLEGVELDVLADGPGHYEGTPQPGEEGNAAIAGHRTTYGQPFNRLDELGDGDVIIITYPNGARFTYEYLNTVIVTPDRTDVLEYKFDNRLTLTACHPKYSAAERIVVSALLREPAAPARPLPDAGEATAPSDLAAAESLDGQDHPKSPAIAWGLAAAMVWLAAWVVGRAWRPWPAYAISLPIFVIVLYGFFENFSHLLPASY
jgi:sortase A